MKNMTHEQAVDAIIEVAEEIGGDVREDYSGRFMYGATCYGIVCDNPNTCMEVAGEKGLRGASVDSMGRGAIVYWRSVKGAE